MRYVVDGNVLSEPTKLSSSERVSDWLVANEADLVVNPIVMGEIWLGVDALAEGAAKRALVGWFEKL